MASLAVSNFTVKPLSNTKYVNPVTIEYTQNNMDKTWEAVESFDSVAILLYHEQKDAFLLVQQFRPPVYMHHKEYSFTYELCAGIIDKDCSLLQIAKEEIEEECGYNVALHRIQKISSFFTNVGVSGAKQYLYFAQIYEEDKVSNGGGIHDEEIELVYVPLKEAKEFVYDENKAKTPGLMFAFYWFFEHYKR
jgi:UDP-sugar diphosphatase